MRILRLDHYNVSGHAEVIEECRRFYSEVLGMTIGYRPPFRSQGFWLYAGDAPLIHLVISTEERPQANPDHIAFACEDYDSTVATLERLKVAFYATDVPMTSQRQLFLTDPAGVGVELNFAGAA
jgi:catechol 2,3-dioxygenase-like lactoylglutathione lyase family enzyme